MCLLRSRRGSNPLIRSSRTRLFSRQVPYRSATAPQGTHRSREIDRSSFDVRSAEPLGFEPREPLTRFNGFQDRRIQPLCHSSAERTPLRLATSPYYMLLSMFCQAGNRFLFENLSVPLSAIRLGAPARVRTGIQG